MSKFLVLADTHAKLRLINKWIQAHPEVEQVLQLGDLGVWTKKDFEGWGYLVDKAGHYRVDSDMLPFEAVVNGEYTFDRPVIFITGNHENFNYRDSINWAELEKRGITWLSPDQPWLVEKHYAIAGLNGCYSYKVYTGNYQKRRKIKVQPETPPHIEEYLNNVMGRDPRGRFKEEDIQAITKMNVDILLLHEVPRGLFDGGELPIPQKPGASPINDLIERLQPRFAFCGHMHMSGETKIGRTRVISLPPADSMALILDTEKWDFELCRNVL